MAKIYIMGAGAFGAALAVTFCKQGHEIQVWARDSQHVHSILADWEGRDKIPVASSLEGIEECDLIVVATASQAVREVCRMIADKIAAKAVVVCVAKGFEGETLKTMSQVMEEELHNPAVILSGPSHGVELANSIPTAVVATSHDRVAAEYVQDTISNNVLRIYVNDDVTGVELGGVLKNVIALAAGALDGMGLGDNTKAALMTRGITEIARLGVACGAKNETFTGLSGIGDLIVTCTSLHSRNRRAGYLIGTGMKAADAIAEVGMVVEGYKTAKSAYELAQLHHVDMPIITQVYKILYEDKPIHRAIEDLMERPKRHESEVVWLLTHKE